MFQRFGKKVKMIQKSGQNLSLLNLAFFFTLGCSFVPSPLTEKLGKG